MAALGVIGALGCMEGLIVLRCCMACIMAAKRGSICAPCAAKELIPPCAGTPGGICGMA